MNLQICLVAKPNKSVPCNQWKLWNVEKLISMDTEGKITRQLLKLHTGEFDIESIHTIKLPNKGISDLYCIGECTNLERADLSHNNISKLYNLAGLSQLNFLNLSSNKIFSLEGMQSLDNLEHLNLAANSITSLESLKPLCCLQKLKELRLNDSLKKLSNPLCSESDYKIKVLELLPSLTVLDGEHLRGKGSELYRMLHEIDQLVEATKPNSYETESPGLTRNLDNLLQVNDKFEKSPLANTENQLIELLDGCKLLTDEADKILQAAE